MNTERLSLLLTNCISKKSLRHDCLQSARLVFKNIECPLDIALWNSLLAAYSRNHLYRETQLLFEELRSFSCVKPDGYTVPSVLKAFGALRCVQDGRKLHGWVIKGGFGDIVVASALVGMYAKCSLFLEACHVFDEMPVKDVASWNTVMSCYYQDGQYHKAVDLFDKMQAAGFMPDSVTYTTFFSSCARLSALEKGRMVHESLIRSGYEMDVFVNSSLVDMYARCGSLVMARKIFDLVPNKTAVTWNSMISGYAITGDFISSVHLFLNMNAEGVKPTSTTLCILLSLCSKLGNLQFGKFMHGYIIRNKVETDIFTDTALLDLYLRCGALQYAEDIFETITKMNCVSWNVMISGLVSRGCYDEALKIFNDMRNSGVKPDAITFASTLQACSQLSALQLGKEMHQYIVENKLEIEEIVAAALVNMYAKCGAVDDARNVFDRMSKRDIVSWTTMITAYGSHGNTLEAIYLFQQMEKSETKPDGVAFLALLSACSHGGLVDEGHHYFDQMRVCYGIDPTLEHYSCVIDLLGRAGRVHEAYDILRHMPIKADVGLLGALFSACSQHGKVELGEKVAELLLEKDPDDASTYIVLSNLYAAAGKWENVRKVRWKMRERGLRKSPGCSWIEVDKRTHTFFVEDKSHPQAETIYETLDSLLLQMKREGYAPKSPNTTYP
ncbi:pentatricopeptide repeat-containing protein At5g27110 isoform X2 [Nymphaea colorata]|uniref:pentatricopeptide repeat-containing protein At5g27110 isoform X2 n=1 Tax=Nymphaea colorata TaxID=210225 RepID=UPI00214E2E3C|nr:pentatricopeptide repeat-containing protein At5g27110 isoform X2 [Nymphaea colorata]